MDTSSSMLAMEAHIALQLNVQDPGGTGPRHPTNTQQDWQQCRRQWVGACGCMRVGGWVGRSFAAAISTHIRRLLLGHHRAVQLRQQVAQQLQAGHAVDNLGGQVDARELHRAHRHLLLRGVRRQAGGGGGARDQSQCQTHAGTIAQARWPEPYCVTHITAWNVSRCKRAAHGGWAHHRLRRMCRPSLGLIKPSNHAAAPHMLGGLLVSCSRCQGRRAELGAVAHVGHVLVEAREAAYGGVELQAGIRTSVYTGKGAYGSRQRTRSRTQDSQKAQQAGSGKVEYLHGCKSTYGARATSANCNAACIVISAKAPPRTQACTPDIPIPSKAHRMRGVTAHTQAQCAHLRDGVNEALEVGRAKGHGKGREATHDALAKERGSLRHRHEAHLACVVLGRCTPRRGPGMAGWAWHTYRATQRTRLPWVALDPRTESEEYHRQQAPRLLGIRCSWAGGTTASTGGRLRCH